MATLSTLSTGELLAHLATLASRDRNTTVDILLSLIEVETRRFHAELNYSSPWAFCIGHLHWTNGTTGRNFAAARLLRRFPAAADYLRDGRLNCSTFLALKEVLTDENHRDLLNRATHLTEEKVLELVVTIAPKPIPAESLRKSPERSSHTAVFGSTASTAPAIAVTSKSTPRIDAQAPTATSHVAQSPSTPFAEFTFEPPPPKPFRPNAQLEPLQKDVWLLKLPIDAVAKANLEEVQSLLSHVMPRASLGDVLLECVRRTRIAAERQKYGTLAPRKKSETAPADSGNDAGGREVPPGTNRTPISGAIRDAQTPNQSMHAPVPTPISGVNAGAILDPRHTASVRPIVDAADRRPGATPILGVDAGASREVRCGTTVCASADASSRTPILGVDADASREVRCGTTVCASADASSGTPTLGVDADASHEGRCATSVRPSAAAAIVTPILGVNSGASRDGRCATYVCASADATSGVPILEASSGTDHEARCTTAARPSDDEPFATPILGVNAGASHDVRCATSLLPTAAAPIATPILGVNQADNRRRAGARPPRRVPRAVRREVAARDGHCCSYVFPNGQRCASKYQLEFDHWLAHALGGEPTVENVRMLCKAHNLQCAVQLFGEEFMARFIRPGPDSQSPRQGDAMDRLGPADQAQYPRSTVTPASVSTISIAGSTVGS
ncbi:MAG: HNH endonuclease [Myxococcaceae bacterium]